jgi:hypothetical protein
MHVDCAAIIKSQATNSAKPSALQSLPLPSGGLIAQKGQNRILQLLQSTAE